MLRVLSDGVFMVIRALARVRSRGFQSHRRQQSLMPSIVAQGDLSPRFLLRLLLECLQVLS